MNRARRIAADLALPVGLACLAWLCIHRIAEIRSASISGENDFRILREAAAEFWSGQSLYTTRTPHGNLNPPHFHLLLLPFTWLQETPAFIVWTLTNLCAAVLALRVVIRELRLSVSFVAGVWLANAALAFQGTAVALWSGQSSLLFMYPAALAWRDARRDFPIRAGVWLGVLMGTKVFLMIFMPFLLLARRWRMFCGAAAALFGSILLGLVVYGSDEYIRWMETLRSVNWAGDPLNASALSIFVRATAMTILATWLWRSCAAAIVVISVMRALRGSIDQAFAILLTGALLSSPLGWAHYSWWAVGPVTASLLSARPMLRHGWRVGVGLIAAAGLLAPPAIIFAAHDHAWARATFGSAYAWGLLALWILLVELRPARATAE